jgi:hypothetical protein
MGGLVIASQNHSTGSAPAQECSCIGDHDVPIPEMPTVDSEPEMRTLRPRARTYPEIHPLMSTSRT